MIGLTGGLLVTGAVQAGLFVWQLRMINGSQADTRTAAEAAKASADALPLMERAYVFVNTGSTEFTSLGQPAGALMNVHLVNLGKTPAYVDTIDAQFALWDRAELSAMRAHPPSDQRITVAAWLGADKSTAHYSVISKDVMDDVRHARSTKSRIEALLGRITYKDVFGTAHETGFAFEWLPEANRLQPINNPELNFTRPREK